MENQGNNLEKKVEQVSQTNAQPTQMNQKPASQPPYQQGQYQQSYNGQQSYNAQQPHNQNQQYQRPQGVHPNYGNPNNGYYQAPQAMPTSQSNGLGIAGFVLGLLGLIFVWVPFLSWILLLIGLILSGVALTMKKAKGLAIAGLVLSVIGILLKIYFALVVGAAISSMLN